MNPRILGKPTYQSAPSTTALRRSHRMLVESRVNTARGALASARGPITPLRNVSGFIVSAHGAAAILSGEYQRPILFSGMPLR